MKIIHTSDLHLDSPLTSRLPADKLRERKRELLRGFLRLIEEARRIGASAIIIAGDLFDSESVTVRTLDTVLDAIAKSPDLHFYYVSGNHDADFSAGSRPIPENLHTFERDHWSVYEVGEGVCITGINEPRDEAYSALDGVLRPDEVNICILHGQLRDKGYAEEDVGRSAVSGHCIDYLALGHYHSYSEERLDDRLTAVYCGTPEGRGFDEAGVKGYSLIEVTGGRLTHRFVPFARRTIHIVELPLDGICSQSELLARADAALSAIPSTDLVRLMLTGSYTPELWKDDEVLRERFARSFYYFEVKDTSGLLIDPEDFKNDKTLKGEFIRRVYAATDLDPELAKQIISCGIHALMGEEFSL